MPPAGFAACAGLEAGRSCALATGTRPPVTDRTVAATHVPTRCVIVMSGSCCEVDSGLLPVYARGGVGGRIPNFDPQQLPVPWENSEGPAGKVFRAVTFARIRMGSSFEDLYRRHVQAVFRFALSVTGDRATAEDVTSEAFLALYRNLDSIDESLLPGLAADGCPQSRA